MTTASEPPALAFRAQGSGPAVLWIHGYTMDASIWDELWGLLPGWRHVGVELPGHGGSPALDAGATLSGVADQVGQVGARAGARRVVALSFGSAVALRLAADQPHLVRRLVIGSPTIAGGPGEPGAGRRYRELAVLSGLAPLMSREIPAGELLADLWMESPPDIFRGTESRPALRARLRSVIARHSWAELRTGAMQAVARDAQSDADLRRITAPTLVFQGEQDMPTFLGNAARLARVLPDCRVECVPQAGHLVLLERPDVVAPALAKHLAG